MHLYGVYQNEQEVFRGCAKDLFRKYGTPPGDLHRLCNGDAYMNGIYRVRIIGTYVPQKKEKPKPIRKTKDEMMLEYIEHHLKIYGNVYCKNDPSKYLPTLKKKGYNLKLKVFKGGLEVYGKYIQLRKRKDEIDYILEVVKNDNKRV